MVVTTSLLPRFIFEMDMLEEQLKSQWWWWAIKWKLPEILSHQKMADQPLYHGGSQETGTIVALNQTLSGQLYGSLTFLGGGGGHPMKHIGYRKSTDDCPLRQVIWPWPRAVYLNKQHIHCGITLPCFDEANILYPVSLWSDHQKQLGFPWNRKQQCNVV